MAIVGTPAIFLPIFLPMIALDDSEQSRRAGLLRMSVPLRRNISVLVCWLTMTCVVLAVRARSWHAAGGVAVESFFYLALLLCFAQSRALRSLLAHLHPGHKLFLALLLGLLTLGHLWQKSRYTFPFVTWSMYGDPVNSDQIVFFDYEGTTAAGAKIRIRPSHLLPSLQNWVLDNKLKELGNQAIAEETGVEQQQYRQRYSDTLLALGRQYNRDHPTLTISSIEVYECRLSLPTHVKGSSVSRKCVWRIAVD